MTRNLQRFSMTTLLLFCASIAGAQDFVSVFKAGDIGGPRIGNSTGIDFVQETGTNPPPGDPNSPAVNQQADDDFYFAGEYPAPIGTVANNEPGFERAFAGSDNDLRIHFNLPDTVNPADQFRFSFEPESLHTDAAVTTDPRYGVEVFFNDVLIFPEVTIRQPELDQVITTDVFTAGDVGAIGGSGGDNVIYLRGINHNADGGGNWMGIHYHELEVAAIPEPACLSLMAGGIIFLMPVLYRRFRK